MLPVRSGALLTSSDARSRWQEPLVEAHPAAGFPCGLHERLRLHFRVQGVGHSEITRLGSGDVRLGGLRANTTGLQQQV